MDKLNKVVIDAFMWSQPKPRFAPFYTEKECISMMCDTKEQFIRFITKIKN